MAFIFYYISEAFDLRHEIRESSSHAEAEEFAQNEDEVNKLHFRYQNQEINGYKEIFLHSRLLTKIQL